MPASRLGFVEWDFINKIFDAINQVRGLVEMCLRLSQYRGGSCNVSARELL